MSEEKKPQAEEVTAGSAELDPALVRKRRFSEIPLNLEMPRRQDRAAIDKARRNLTLDDLLRGMTPANRQPEIDFGRPVGREFPNEEAPGEEK